MHKNSKHGQVMLQQVADFRRIQSKRNKLKSQSSSVASKKCTEQQNWTTLK